MVTLNFAKDREEKLAKDIVMKYEEIEKSAVKKNRYHQGDEKVEPRVLVKGSPLNDNAFRIGTNSFINSIVEAYNQHNHLIIRPDDVWIAIMTQFSNYVRMNAETLRDKFVNFEGKKELEIVDNGTLFNAPYEKMTMRMADMISSNLKDQSIRDWVIPSFTTTTATDQIVGAITLMSSMKNFFSYKYSLRCGFPRVTLEGTIDDWRALRTKAQRLEEFDTKDQYMKKWLTLLLPVLDKFILSFSENLDDPSDEAIEFWYTVANYISGGSGPTYLSGWITVFCVFDDKGKWVGDNKKAKGQETQWIFIDSQDIPCGFTKTPLTIDDNGRIYKAEIFSGHMAFSSPDETTIAPRLDWCILLKD